MIDDAAAFPNLNAENHRVTKPRDETYNCIAWAAGRNDEWWSPKRIWPGHAPRDEHKMSLVIVFESIGFRLCADGSHQDGIEKIALYVSDDGNALHAARQLVNGKWTSKLGEEEEIEHDSPQNVAEGEYGHLWKFMKRKRGTSENDRFVFLFPLGHRAYAPEAR